MKPIEVWFSGRCPDIEGFFDLCCRAAASIGLDPDAVSPSDDDPVFYVSLGSGGTIELEIHPPDGDPGIEIVGIFRNGPVPDCGLHAAAVRFFDSLGLDEASFEDETGYADTRDVGSLEDYYRAHAAQAGDGEVASGTPSRRRVLAVKALALAGVFLLALFGVAAAALGAILFGSGPEKAGEFAISGGVLLLGVVLLVLAGLSLRKFLRGPAGTPRPRTDAREIAGGLLPLLLRALRTILRA